LLGLVLEIIPGASLTFHGLWDCTLWLHFLDVIFAFLSQRRRPVCKRWACTVRSLTTHCTVLCAHSSRDYAKNL